MQFLLGAQATELIAPGTVIYTAGLHRRISPWSSDVRVLVAAGGTSLAISHSHYFIILEDQK